jgi:hypothetical protein
MSSNVLEALDVTWSKLRAWAPEALKEIGANSEDIEKAKGALSHDVLIFVPKLKQMLADYHEPLEKRDVTFFLYLMPAKYHHLQIPKHISDKGFLYLEVFQGLLNDLSDE